HLRAPVKIADGQSALLPVVSLDLPAERWSLYQPEIERKNPLFSVRLTNKSDTDLPPGAMSVYEARDSGGPLTYVGDARLTPLPPGEDRTVSYAVDQKVKINKEEQRPQKLTIATIVAWTLRLTRVERKTTVYTIAGAAQEPRTVIIEHPIQKGWEIAGPEE